MNDKSSWLNELSPHYLLNIQLTYLENIFIEKMIIPKLVKENKIPAKPEDVLHALFELAMTKGEQ